MLPILDVATMQQQGAAALAEVRAGIMRGRPPELAQFFELQWQMFTRLSWAVADRVVRNSCSYQELGRDAAKHLVSILRSRASDVPHVDRWLERHDDMLCHMGAEIAEHVDRALDFPLGVLVDVDIDRRGRLIQRRRALRDDFVDEMRPTKAKRKPRALVPDERVTERALDAIAATLGPDELRADRPVAESAPSGVSDGR
jgi:hypothetical protein